MQQPSQVRALSSVLACLVGSAVSATLQVERYRPPILVPRTVLQSNLLNRGSYSNSQLRAACLVQAGVPGLAGAGYSRLGTSHRLELGSVILICTASADDLSIASLRYAKSGPSSGCTVDRLTSVPVRVEPVHMQSNFSVKSNWLVLHNSQQLAAAAHWIYCPTHLFPSCLRARTGFAAPALPKSGTQ